MLQVQKQIVFHYLKFSLEPLIMIGLCLRRHPYDYQVEAFLECTNTHLASTNSKTKNLVYIYQRFSCFSISCLPNITIIVVML